MSASLPRWLSSRPPSAALEIDARRVTAVVLGRQGGAHIVSSHATEPLPAGAVEPSLNAINVHDPDALASAIRSVLERVTPRPRRVALVLPDTVAKFSLLRFEKTPAKVQDLDQLIRWQVRKAAPFRIEDAQLAWIPGVMLPGGGREYLVSVVRRDVIESYETACVAAGAQPGIVDLASVNLVNAVLALHAGESAGSDWLLVHVAADYGTVAVVRGRDVIFFRTRPADRQDDLADLVHQTSMYHEDRLGGGGFARVVLAGASSRGHETADRIRQDLEQRVGSPVEALDFRPTVALRDRIAAGPDVLDALAPSVGVLLRERVA
ncbi:MAG: pilus assembly protein PilM [Acidobacteriota bacterium]|nr:pilus assembly protein PilM [Acidobacteriota bacterium]